ncbi:MAG: HAD family hydrolase [Lachnospiraceae bacterium]|nr:HAD family hydrolase [Lachnospiraceae bacterium]
MEQSMLKAMIFDLDDTLYAYEPLDKKARINVEKFTCEALGISGEQYKEAYRFGREETKKRLPDVGAGHNRLLYCQKTLEYLGVPPMPLSLRMYEQYWGTFLREMQLFPGVKELFSLLEEKQIPIMICTDLTAHVQHRKIEALGIASDIKYLVSSEEAGKEKPAREIFDLCLEKLNLPPEHIWYVGDNFKKDVEGAMQAGIQAVWFHPQESIVKNPDSKGKTAYLEAGNYQELKNMVAEELKMS